MSAKRKNEVYQYLHANLRKARNICILQMQFERVKYERVNENPLNDSSNRRSPL
jgi:hypothetical protein